MSYKIDPSFVREKYAAMSDIEILEFAKNESSNLTPDAVILLLNELRKRNIGAEVAENIGQQVINQHEIATSTFEHEMGKELFARGWDLAFKMKLASASDYEIHNALQKIGINSNFAFYIIKTLKDKSDSLLKDSQTDIQASIAIVVVGLALVYFTLRIERFEAGAILIVVAGIIRTFISISKKHRFQKLQEIFDSEKLPAKENSQ